MSKVFLLYYSLFFDEGREELAQLIFDILKPGVSNII